MVSENRQGEEARTSVMVRNSNRWESGVLLLILLFMGFNASLFAGGKVGDKQDETPHPDLERASRLIGEGELDKAMSILAEVGRSFPNQIELVQELVLEIRDIKNEITGLFEKVRDILVSEELNLNQKVVETEEVIRQIKLKDRNPTGNTWRKIAIVESILGRSLDLLRREIFFERGNEKLEQGLYREAVHEYRQGFINDHFGESQTYERYRGAVHPSDIEVVSPFPDRNLTIFEAYKQYAPEGDVIISELISLIDRWNLANAEFSRDRDRASAVISPEDLANWIELDLVNSLNLEYREGRAMLPLGSRLNEVMNRLYESLNGIPEDFRYDRILSFLNGRTGRENIEGIIYAQTLQWESSFFEALSAMLSIVSSTYYEGISKYQSQLWAEGVSLFSLSSASSGNVLEFTAAMDGHSKELASAGISRFSDRLEPILLELKTLAEASEIRAALTEISETLPRLESKSTPAADIKLVQVLSESMQDSVNQIENLLVTWNRYSDQITREGEIANANVRRVVNDLQADLLELLQSLSSEKASAFLQYFGPRFQVLDSMAKDLVRESGANIAAANKLLDEGRPRAAIVSQITPSLELMETLSGNIDDFLVTVAGTQETELNDDETRRNLAEYEDKANALLADIAQLRNQWGAVRDNAIARQNAALRAETIALAILEEAEESLEAAREANIQGQATNSINASYRAKDFYISLIDLLARGRDSFLEIKNNDIDIAKGSGIQERLAELERFAYNEPRDLAVTVRDYAIVEADKQFSERLFDSGLNLLLLAQDFWVSTFGEEDTRLRLRIVRFRTAQHSALKTRIEPSNPLFREMNQYLNLANQRYQEGIRRLETDTADPQNALRLFSEAEDLLQQVLNVFPGNAAALLLQKKILKVKEPGVYNETVRKLIEDANAAVQNGDSAALTTGVGSVPPLDPQLHAVSAFDPDFPGLSSTIERVDIYLGRIILLPTQAEIEESGRITESVENDWRQTLNLSVDAIAAASPSLIERLDTALQLWENNIDAANLQDEIRFYIRPQALPDNLRNLIAVADEQRLRNNRSSVETIYRSIASSFPAFIRHPEIIKIKYWLDIE